MHNAIELLSPELITRHPDLVNAVQESQTELNHFFGWHYLLDYVWILQKARHLPPGSLILDAGAGQGMLQVMLARMGHKVISTDFAPRVPPRAYAERCSIVAVHNGEEIDHENLRHLEAVYAAPGAARPTVSQAPTDLTALFVQEDADIVYYTADIGRMPQVPDHCIDAVFSISALEHNDHAGVRRAVAELERVLKPGAPMRVTVSAAKDKDWFHSPSKGWCFSEPSLVELFGLSYPYSNFAEFDRIFALIREGSGLKEHLAPFYFKSGDNGMPWGLWNPQYQPVGVARLAPDTVGRQE